MKTMISRRGFLCAAGIASASAVLTACGGSSSSTASSTASSAAASSEAASGESMELIVFAAASLTETLNAIAETYSAENPGVTFSFNFDSSGTLKTQIQEGADCDLFISAGQKQMNQLDSTASAEVNTEGLDFVDAESRVDLLENKVVLCVPEGSDKGIDSFDSLAEHLKAQDILFCMGNSDVPVGQYTQKILAYYDLDEAALAAAGVITYGSNVQGSHHPGQRGQRGCWCRLLHRCVQRRSDPRGRGHQGDVRPGHLPRRCDEERPPCRGCQGVPGLPAHRQGCDRVRERRLHRTVSIRWGDGMDWYPLWNSLRIALISCAAVFFLGIFAAYYIAKLPRVLKGVLDVVLTLPMVLPPTVVGYFLLLLFGAKKAAGHLFHGTFRREAGHELVQRHLCFHRGGLSADVPHGPRCL